MTNDDEILTTEELAERTKFTCSFWNNRRMTGDTPPYLKFGKAVRYKWSDVKVWLEKQMKFVKDVVDEDK